jgi:hypothetical protein
MQGPSEKNGDNLNKVRHETSRHFRNKKREISKTNLMRLQQAVRMRTSQIYIEE